MTLEPGDGKDPKNTTDSWTSSSSSSSSSNSEIGEEIEISESFQPHEKQEDEASSEPPALPPQPPQVEESATSGGEIEEEIEEAPPSIPGSDAGATPMLGNVGSGVMIQPTDDDNNALMMSAPGVMDPSQGGVYPVDDAEGSFAADTMEPMPQSVPQPAPSATSWSEEEAGAPITSQTGDVMTVPPGDATMPPEDEDVAPLAPPDGDMPALPSPGMDSAPGGTASTATWSEGETNTADGTTAQNMGEGSAVNGAAPPGMDGAGMRGMSQVGEIPPPSAVDETDTNKIPEDNDDVSPGGMEMDAMGSLQSADPKIGGNADDWMESPPATQEARMPTPLQESGDEIPAADLAKLMTSVGEAQPTSSSGDTTEASADEDLANNMFPVQADPFTTGGDALSALMAPGDTAEGSSGSTSGSSGGSSSDEEESQPNAADATASLSEPPGTAQLSEAVAQNDTAPDPSPPPEVQEQTERGTQPEKHQTGSEQEDTNPEQPRLGSPPADPTSPSEDNGTSMFGGDIFSMFGGGASEMLETEDQAGAENVAPSESMSLATKDAGSSFSGSDPIEATTRSQPEQEGVASSDPPGEGQSPSAAATAVSAADFDPPSLFGEDAGVPGTASQTEPLPATPLQSSFSQTSPTDQQLQTAASQTRPLISQSSGSQTISPEGAQLRTTASQTATSERQLANSASQIVTERALISSASQTAAPSLTRASQTAPSSGARPSSSAREAGSQTQQGLARDVPPQSGVASTMASSAQGASATPSGAAAGKRVTLSGILGGSKLAALAREGIQHLTAGDDSTFGSPEFALLPTRSDFPVAPNRQQLVDFAAAGVSNIATGRDTTFGSPELGFPLRQGSQTDGFEPESDTERQQPASSASVKRSGSRSQPSRIPVSVSASQQAKQKQIASPKSSRHDSAGSSRTSQVDPRRRVTYSSSQPLTNSSPSSARVSQTSTRRASQPNSRVTIKQDSRRQIQPDALRSSQLGPIKLSQSDSRKKSMSDSRRPNQLDSRSSQSGSKKPTQSGLRQSSRTIALNDIPSSFGRCRPSRPTESSRIRVSQTESRRRPSEPDARRRPSQSPPTQVRPPHSDSDLLRTDSSDQQPADCDGMPKLAQEFKSYECIESRLRLCEGQVPYRYTALPNYAGADSEQQVIDGLPYYQVVAESGCSPLAMEYVCAAIEPECVQDPAPRALPPCRQFCQEIVGNCGMAMSATMRRNPAFDCGQFPDSRDPSQCYSSVADRCIAGEFACTDGTSCVPSSWRCDGTPQCDDASDELSCVQCTRDQFRCRSDGGCVPPGGVCDGFADCAEGEDERDCVEQGAAFSSAVASSEDVR